MKFKGTKGEWINGWGNGLTGPTTPSCQPLCDEDRRYIPISIGKETISIVIQPCNNSILEMQANAKLIAAAPEMFEMLNLLLDNSDVPNEIFDKAKQLLTKITQ